MRLVLVAVLLLGSALPSSTAAAKGKTEAKEAFKRALQYYNLGDFQKALDGFKEAYLDYPDSSFLFNIGQCQRQLGLKQEAVLSYKAYLREDPSSPRRDEILAIVHNLEGLIREDEAAKKGRPEGTLGPDSSGGRPEVAPPPTGTTAPEPTASAPTTLTAEAPPRERTPVYKKWWLWTAVGVVAVGVGVGLGVGLAPHGTKFPNAPPSDGTIHF